jgi:hypothetical protein
MGWAAMLGGVVILLVLGLQVWQQVEAALTQALR